MICYYLLSHIYFEIQSIYVTAAHCWFRKDVLPKKNNNLETMIEVVLFSSYDRQNICQPEKVNGASLKASMKATASLC